MKKHYSCICCGDSYLASHSTQDTGCKLCGSSIVVVEITDSKILEILESNAKKIPISEKLLKEHQSYRGIDF